MNLFRKLIRRQVSAKDKNGTEPSGAVAIGTQIARASAAQRRHEETHGAPNSPLADLRYSSIENRRWRWVDSPIDSRIEAVATDFAALGEAERNSVRDTLSMDDSTRFLRSPGVALLQVFAAAKPGRSSPHSSR